MSRLFEALSRSEAERAGGEGHSSGLQTPEHEAVEFPQFRSVHVVVGEDGRLVSLTNRASLAAEKFRLLALRLRHLQQSRKLKKVLITSTLPQEGKSTIAANLAIALAQTKRQRVLLLEADLRRPQLEERFGLGQLPGMTELLENDLSFMAAIYKLEVPGLWILPAGSSSDNPLELLHSKRLVELLDELTPIFDWIVIDSPPVLPLADTSLWARVVDGVVLVCREGASAKKYLQKGLEMLDTSALLGVVFNGCSNTDRDNYYYKRYSPTKIASSPIDDSERRT